MLCPNCTTEKLITSERQNVQIDHCPQCRGIWLDRGELEKLLRMDASGESQSEGYNGREFGEDEEAPRKRTYRENDRDDDDDERGESYRGRDTGDDDRGETYRNRNRDDDDRGDRNLSRDRDYGQQTGRDDSQGGRSIWREILENLGDKLPRTQ